MTKLYNINFEYCKQSLRYCVSSCQVPDERCHQNDCLAYKFSETARNSIYKMIKEKAQLQLCYDLSHPPPNHINLTELFLRPLWSVLSMKGHFSIVIDLRNQNLRSAYKNFMRQCALRNLLKMLSISAPCGLIWAYDILIKIFLANIFRSGLF